MNAKRANFVLLVMAAGGYGEDPLSSVANAQDLEPYRIAVDVDLVVLHATVRDRRGRAAVGLRQEDFEVYEDGVRQSIRLFHYEDTPVTVGLVVDHSGSMRPKLAQVIAAARAFVHASNPDDEMFAVNFNEEVSLGLPAGIPFTNRSSDLEQAISSVPAAGMTALYGAVAAGLKHLRLGRHDKQALLVISDGGDNASARSLADVVKMAEQSNAVIYTIGLSGMHGSDRDPGVLKRLARATGGEAFFPRELGAAVEVCETIARDIRNQYTIGYVSTNTAPNDAYRSIRVAARAAGRGKLHVRTRAGYVAPGEPGSGEEQEGAP